MNTKHTTGPWKQGTRGPNGCPIIGNGRGLMIAMLAHSDKVPDQVEQAEANALLIAAAPEMLEALQDAATYLVERGIHIRGVIGRTIILPKMQAAIAKATGKEGA